MKRCVYCGVKLRDRKGRYTAGLVLVACGSHSDLLLVDPHFRRWPEPQGRIRQDRMDGR